MNFVRTRELWLNFVIFFLKRQCSTVPTGFGKLLVGFYFFLMFLFRGPVFSFLFCSNTWAFEILWAIFQIHGKTSNIRALLKLSMFLVWWFFLNFMMFFQIHELVHFLYISFKFQNFFQTRELFLNFLIFLSQCSTTPLVNVRPLN